jgi:ribosomal protein S18 acetylase RimI-like enzyme
MPDHAQSEEITDSSISLDAGVRLPNQTFDWTLLDNPIWGALSTEHAELALGDERARRYPVEVGPLSGIPAQTEESYKALSDLAGDGVVVLFSVEPIVPIGGLQVVRSGPIVQMIRKIRGVEADVGELTPRRLTAADAPAMVALAELTEPGPFRLRTLELGNFYGIFHGPELVAMAGKRMHMPGLVEVSGVCTHPAARGKGYARRLMQIVMDEIERDGKTAFLHAFSTNPAIRLYETLGFEARQEFHFAALVNGSKIIE